MCFFSVLSDSDFVFTRVLKVDASAADAGDVLFPRRQPGRRTSSELLRFIYISQLKYFPVVQHPEFQGLS